GGCAPPPSGDALACCCEPPFCSALDECAKARSSSQLVWKCATAKPRASRSSSRTMGEITTGFGAGGWYGIERRTLIHPFAMLFSTTSAGGADVDSGAGRRRGDRAAGLHPAIT